MIANWFLVVVPILVLVSYLFNRSVDWMGSGVEAEAVRARAYLPAPEHRNQAERMQAIDSAHLGRCMGAPLAVFTDTRSPGIGPRAFPIATPIARPARCPLPASVALRMAGIRGNKA